VNFISFPRSLSAHIPDTGNVLIFSMRGARFW
jgi:hypothetical protein